MRIQFGAAFNNKETEFTPTIVVKIDDQEMVFTADKCFQTDRECHQFLTKLYAVMSDGRNHKNLYFANIEGESDENHNRKH